MKKYIHSPMPRRPSMVQMEAFTEFLENNSWIAKSMDRSAVAKYEAKKKWADLAETLNSLEGATKDGRGWAKYWAEKKFALKKAMATKGGTPYCMNSLDRRLIAVIEQQETPEDLTQIISTDPLSDSNPPATSPSPSAEDNKESVFLGQIINIPPPVRPKTPQEKPKLSRPETLRTSCGPGRRIRVLRPSTSYEGALQRMSRIEERRVETERATAEALANMASALQANAVAMQNISVALANIGNAMSTIAHAVSNNNKQETQ